MLADRLKAATETNHQQLEKQLVLRMKAISTKPEYAALLQLFYTYFGGLEEQIGRHINASHLPDYAGRRKTEALAADIRALGSAPEAKAEGDDLPPLHNALQAFGALYVIEGSTLGGQIISKMMARQLGLEGDEGLTFFSGYGEHSIPMWNAFKQALNIQAKTPAEEDEVIASADNTFVKFKLWTEKQGRLTSRLN